MKNQINRDLSEIMRDEMVMKERILSRLREEPATIPEIARSLEFPGTEVMFWIMVMWRYGIIEGIGKPDEDGYYKYQPAK